MKSTAGTAPDHSPINPRLSLAGAIVLAALSVTLLVACQGVAHAAAAVTGFAEPFAGTPKFERFAPTEATSPRLVNRPLGIKAADRIARKLGLDKRQVFTARQYRLFISGRGVGGDPKSAKLLDQSVRIFANTTDNPLFANVNGKVTRVVLGSYGLMVSTDGLLESLANTNAPTRKVNKLIEPGGYIPTWCRHNGARAALRQLYRSAYSSEVIYGNRSQQQSGVAELVPNQKGRTGTIVGMSMAPSIWIVNFVLLYTLNPTVAAKMPAPLDADPSERGAGGCGEPHRPDSFQSVRVVVSRLIAEMPASAASTFQEEAETLRAELLDSYGDRPEIGSAPVCAFRGRDPFDRAELAREDAASTGQRRCLGALGIA